MQIIIANVIGSIVQGIGNTIPSSAVRYEDNSPVLYEDGTYVLYEIL